MRKYGRFGIAFLKPFLVAKGGNPVFYVAKDARLPGPSVVPTGSASVELLYNISRAELLDRIHSEALTLSTGQPAGLPVLAHFAELIVE